MVAVSGLPERIESGRVRLILISPDDAADMLAGRRQERWHADYPRRDDVDAASMIGPREGAADGWGPRHVVVDGLAVGSIGFFGPPVDGEVEVGYGLVEAARGRGIATEALDAVLEHVDRLGVRVRASTEPENTASLRVLAKAGFTQLRGSDDEGRLVLARPTPDRG